RQRLVALVAVELRVREQAERLGRLGVGVARGDARRLRVAHALLIERQTAYVQQRPRLGRALARHPRIGGPLVELLARGAERRERRLASRHRRRVERLARGRLGSGRRGGRFGARTLDRHDDRRRRLLGCRLRLLLRLHVRLRARGRLVTGHLDQREDHDDGGSGDAGDDERLLPARRHAELVLGHRLRERVVAAVVDLDDLAVRLLARLRYRDRLGGLGGGRAPALLGFRQRDRRRFVQRARAAR